jgi:hypothetical protein
MLDDVVLPCCDSLPPFFVSSPMRYYWVNSGSSGIGSTLSSGRTPAVLCFCSFLVSEHTMLCCGHCCLAAATVLCPVLPCPALSCPVLPCPVLPCPALSCPVLPCPFKQQPGPSQGFLQFRLFCIDPSGRNVCMAGEAAASPRWMTSGTWYMAAKTAGALMVGVEHRFYGASVNPSACLHACTPSRVVQAYRVW